MNATATAQKVARRTPIHVARQMSSKQIALRIREALIERTGHNWRVTCVDGTVKIKAYSLKNRRELRQLLSMGAVPMSQFCVRREDKLVEYLRRAEGYSC